METMRSYYLVTEGEVTDATPNTAWDGKRSVLTYATDEAEALRLAHLRDRGLAQEDNQHLDNGQVIAVLRRENVPDDVWESV